MKAPVKLGLDKILFQGQELKNRTWINLNKHGYIKSCQTLLAMILLINIIVPFPPCNWEEGI